MEIEIEAFLRLASFSILLAALVLIETVAPRVRRSLSRLIRWPANFGAGFMNILLPRLLLPASATGVAWMASERGIGLFNALTLDPLISVVLAVVALDLVIYFQHRAMHVFPLLWRLHRMHHTDTDIDVSTALRFHPFEILLSMLIKFAAIALLGAAPLAVLIFEVMLNGCAMFNHSNLKLPSWLDAQLRKIIVTPDMHRVHHSVVREERDTNFGFSVSTWDRVFGTYTDQPAGGIEGMTTGLPGYDAMDSARIDRMLADPLKS